MNSKDRECLICNKLFVVKYQSIKTKTCSKACKNILAGQITTIQFASQQARDNAREVAHLILNNAYRSSGLPASIQVIFNPLRSNSRKLRDSTKLFFQKYHAAYPHLLTSFNQSSPPD